MPQQNNVNNYSLLEVLDKSISMCDHVENYSKTQMLSSNDPSKADNFRRRAIVFGKLSIDLAHSFNHQTAIMEIFTYLTKEELPIVKPSSMSDNAWSLYSSIVNNKTITMYENNIPQLYIDLNKTWLSGENK